jgi:hypothetical protein
MGLSKLSTAEARAKSADCETSKLGTAVTGEERFQLKCINTIRTLSMDAVQAANSGHPGTAMAMAPVDSSERADGNPSDPYLHP